MIDIIKCQTNSHRFILKVGKKHWHISYKEASHLLKKLITLLIEGIK